MNQEKRVHKDYNKLSKKEKSELEKSNKTMFEDFTKEYDNKAQNLMYQIMPNKIKQLNDIFNVLII